MRLLIGLLAGGLLWAQIESANSYVALILGSAVPSGPSAAKGAIYPTHGYLKSGAALGFQVTTFIMPYLSLNLRLSQSFLTMDREALGKPNSLFPAGVVLDKVPSVSHTSVGFGVGTGGRLDILSVYVPLYLAMNIYSAPEIRAQQSATKYWIQDKHSAFQLGVTTGVVFGVNVLETLQLGLSILFTTASSGTQTFERRRYDSGNVDFVVNYSAPIRTDLTEVGLFLGYNF